MSGFVSTCSDEGIAFSTGRGKKTKKVEDVVSFKMLSGKCSGMKEVIDVNVDPVV